MPRRVTGIVVAAVAALLVALPVAAPGSGPVVLAASATVHIGDALDPKILAATPGTSVTWVNDSGNRHRVRSTSGPTEFDSGDLDPGQTYTVTFAATGTWQYRDERDKENSSFWGRVEVKEAPTPAPSPAPTPAPTSAPPGPTPAPTPVPPPPPGDISMAGRAFTPPTLTIDPGATVRWRNDDGRQHTVTAVDRSFDSGVLAVGATYSRAFTAPGSYAYLCAIHPDMTGTITVRSAGGATPPPTPLPTPVPPPAPTPAPGPGTLSIVDFSFSPSSVDVAQGTTVTWVNSGAALHTVTAGDGRWDSGLLAPRATFSHRFTTSGTYTYLCALHPAMQGVVRVLGANGATPPPPAPTPVPTKPPVPAGAYEIRDFAFVPASIRVTPGTTVTWVNTGVAPHTVSDRAGSFDSGVLKRGARWSRAFGSPGTYRLLCLIHPAMQATLVVAAPGATAPPAATPAPVATPAPGSNEVAAIDFAFAPEALQVALGTTVRWRNAGVAPHTVTAADGSFNSGLMDPGAVYERTFTAEGRVEYLCAIHPGMRGTIVIGGDPGVPLTSAGSPTPMAPPSQAAASGDTASLPRVSPGPGGGIPGGASAPPVEVAGAPRTADGPAGIGIAVLLSAAAIAAFLRILQLTIDPG